MIIQLGALLGSAIQGLGGVLSTSLQAVAPTLLQAGNQFLQRELQRKLGREQNNQVRAQAIQVLNTPGISVARVGGTTQPVGGRVQRSTFTSATTSPAQSPIGNIPLLPVGLGGGVIFPRGLPVGGAGGVFPLTSRNQFPSPRGFPVPQQANLPAIPGMLGGLQRQVGGAKVRGFLTDENGNSIKFVPLPDGRGFVTVQQALQMGLKATRPHWRFNEGTGLYEKMKGRRMNPFNFKAASRAGRRIDATLDAVKEFVRIEKKMKSGKVQLKRRKKRKK